MSFTMAEARPPALGALSDRIEIRRRDVSVEDEGGEVATFVPIATVWGRVRALSARQASLADGRVAAITHSVVLRYRTDVAPGDRLVVAGRILTVIGADDLNGRRAFLSCTCSEQTVTG
jgi:SPP1 family predicted phage head-tail adaptor